MSDDDVRPDELPPRHGEWTAEEGTPAAVDISADVRARRVWVVFLGGPAIWFLHFMVVYIVVEAGCTGDGQGLRLLNPPVPTIVTLVATVVAALACVAFTVWAFRRWRKRATTDYEAAVAAAAADPGGGLAFAGFLLSALSFLAVLFVGVPALVLPAC